MENINITFDANDVWIGPFKLDYVFECAEVQNWLQNQPGGPFDAFTAKLSNEVDLVFLLVEKIGHHGLRLYEAACERDPNVTVNQVPLPSLRWSDLIKSLTEIGHDSGKPSYYQRTLFFGKFEWATTGDFIEKLWIVGESPHFPLKTFKNLPPDLTAKLWNATHSEAPNIN